MTERILQDIAEQKKRLTKAQISQNTAEKADSYCKLDDAYFSLGDVQQAMEYPKQHWSIVKKLGDREEEGLAYLNLAQDSRMIGDFQRAIEHLNQALRIANEVGNKGAKRYTYHSLGNVYIDVGDFRRAIEYHELELGIAKEVRDRESKGIAYYGLGNAYLRLDEYAEAFKYLNQSLNIAKEFGNRSLEAASYGLLGVFYQTMGDLPQAIDYVMQDLNIAKELGRKGSENTALCFLGKCYRSSHDFKAARECFKQHLTISEETGDRQGEACAHNRLGVSFMESDSLNKALEHFECSAKIYDTIRAHSISEDQLKIIFCTQRNCSYTHLWKILVMLERNDEALYAAERGRARALRDALKVTYGLTSLSPRSIESEEEVRNISRKTTVLTVFLALQKKTVNMWVLGKEDKPIFRQAEIEIGREHEDPFTLLLDTVLKKIGAGVGVRCENRSMDQLSDDSTSNTRDEHQTSEPSQETTNCLPPLYDVLTGPIEDLLDGDELIVVPDGALSKAPWAALSETLRIRTVPSLTSLKVITDSPSGHHSKSGALLVGDPCLEKVTNRGGKPVYDPLKYARMEVEMIGEILKSKTLTGEDATKEAVLQRIASVALVHIAAHGRKETGEIVLAPDPRWGSKTFTEEDYILKMSDIQAVKLRVRLVVLSCCHSGQGPVSSEGVVGMARAFLFAGARSVLATLWAIDDEATMMFMKSFYQQLASGESASVALQRAMKCLRDSHNYSAPKYWAPFVLMGDDVKIELGGKKSHCASRKCFFFLLF